MYCGNNLWIRSKQQGLIKISSIEGLFLELSEYSRSTLDQQQSLIQLMILNQDYVWI